MPHRPFISESPRSPYRALPLLFASLLFLSFASPAHAQAEEGADALGAPAETPSSTRVVSVEVLGGTTAPIDAWLGARLVFFKRLFLTASVGRSVYGGVAGSIVRQIGGDTAAAIVEPIFRNGWTVRVGGGVRPFGASGPELVAGYAFMGASASWSTSAFGLPDNGTNLSADARLNMFFAELGWTIPLLGPVFLRPAVGWTQVLSADVSIATSAPVGSQNIARANAEAEDALVTYGRTPTLSLAVGAQF